MSEFRNTERIDAVQVIRLDADGFEVSERPRWFDESLARPEFPSERPIVFRSLCGEVGLFVARENGTMGWARRGDWIVLCEDGRLDVLTDRQMRERYERWPPVHPSSPS